MTAVRIDERIHGMNEHDPVLALDAAAAAPPAGAGAANASAS
jgi:hypothetical protein